MQHRKRAHHRHWHSQQRNDGGAPGLQEQDHHDHHQGDGFDQRLDNRLDGRTHELCGVVRNPVLHTFGHVLLDLVHGPAHIGRDVERVGARGLEHAHAHGRVVVEQRAQRIVGSTQLQAGDVAQACHRAVGAGLDDDVAKLFLGRQTALGVDGQLQVHARQAGRCAHHTGSGLHVLPTDGRHHIAGREAALRDLLGVQPHAHRIVAAAKDLHLAHAANAGEPVLHVEHGVVAQVVDVVAVVGRDQVHHHGQVRRALDGGDAQAAHLFRQAWLGLRDTVLHQLLRLVRVGAQLEGHGQRHHTVGRGLAAHVEHAFHTVDGFLQRRGHGLGDHLGVGAWVLGAHHHRRRRDLGVFGDGQTAQCDEPPQEDEHRQHPGKDGAVNEKTGQVHTKNS